MSAWNVDDQDVMVSFRMLVYHPVGCSLFILVWCCVLVLTNRCVTVSGGQSNKEKVRNRGRKFSADLIIFAVCVCAHVVFII